MWKARFRHTVLALMDATMAASAVSLALFLRFDGNVPTQYLNQLSTAIPLFVAVRLASLWVFRAYSSLWRYATLREALSAMAGIGVGSVVLFTVAMTTSVMRLPRSVFAIEALLFSLFAAAPRFLVRWRRGRGCTRRHSGVRSRCLSSGQATPAPCSCVSLTASRTWACTSSGSSTTM